MITTLRTTNIYRVLDAIPAITSLARVFSQKPSDDYVKNTVWDDSYIYMSIVTDITNAWSDSWTNWGSITKDTIVSFNIVAWLNKAGSDTDVLYDIVDILNDEIADEGCQKIDNWDGVLMNRVTELSTSPIVYNTKNRPVLVKQYLFTYYAK